MSDYTMPSYHHDQPDVTEVTEAAPSEKRNKFIKLAERRTINAIERIRLIGKLSNRQNYEYDNEDVQKIAKALNDEVEIMKKLMETKQASAEVNFKL